MAWGSHRVLPGIKSALKDLRAPYCGNRELTVRFGGLGDPFYLPTLNGNDRQNLLRQELENGIPL